MPTPFMHLDYANRMLQSPQLDNQVRTFLTENLADFYLGSVAADFQALCAVPREQTHFYAMPPSREHDAIGRLFAENPWLQQANTLSDAINSFMAGYIAHLNFDLVWFRSIALPFFLHNEKVAGLSRAERSIMHNILLTYLDKMGVASLPATSGNTLASAQTPSADIAFLDPAQIGIFQAMLVEQLKPGAAIRTIEIYAERMGLTPTQFGQHLDDTEWMQTQLFERIPLGSVLSILEQAVHDSAELISTHFANYPLKNLPNHNSLSKLST